MMSFPDPSGHGPLVMRPVLLLTALAYFALCLAGGLELYDELHLFVVNLLLILLGISGLRQVLLLLFALRDRRPGPDAASQFANSKVSIIMPAYNEEAVIDEALESLIGLHHARLQIIVVDDGSSDQTAERASAVARRHPDTDIQIILQGNGGKAAALNTGLLHADGEFVLAVDADSRLSRDALRHGLAYFRDPAVGAVGGFVEVANTDTLIGRFQELEYLYSLNFVRRALSTFGAVTVVPGPVGLFRRSALLRVCGYRQSESVFAEDADITVRLLAAGYRVHGDRRMISRTEAPASLFPLLRQRYRWRRGIYQAFADNAFGLFTAPGGRGLALGLFLAAEGFALEVINLGLTLFFFAHFLRFAEVDLFSSWYLVVLGLDLLIFAFVNGDVRRTAARLPLFVVQRFSYAFLLQAWNVLALFDEWRQLGMSWDKLERKGIAEVDPA